MPTSGEQALPVVRVGEIESEPSGQRWLVEVLWGASSVGVIGGALKCAKTWLGLDMALSDPDICLTGGREMSKRIVLGAAPQSPRFIALRPKHGM
jgi:hypothetical protein